MKIDLSRAEKSKFPHHIKPMLATLVDEPFEKPGWLFEVKWDGFRAIAEVEKKKVKLYSRNHQPFEEMFALIVKTLKSFKFDAVFDGEVVVVDDKGRSHFQLLQNYRNTGKGNLVYYIFDILFLNGHSLKSLTLLERKEILKKVLPKTKNVRFSDHVLEDGVEFFKVAQKGGLEGIIAKGTESEYKTGLRSKEWLKIKTHMQQEAVIGGFTEPKGGRKRFGAVVLGVYEGDKLKYIGHTGGGFNQNSLEEVYKKLKPLIQKESPFSTKFKTNAPVTWVKPKLLAEVAFQEWTSDGSMRQPIFLGLRSDKKPQQVVKEIPKETPTFSKEKPKNEIKLEFGKKLVTITHPDKVFWPARLASQSVAGGPKEKITKRDLVEYYQQAAKWILPYLKDRPENLNRHPNGIEGESFYQKDVDHMPPSWAKTKKVFSESNNKDINYLVCQDEATLLYMVNLGCIEINPWNARIANLDKPDYLIVDLDPEDISFEKVIEAAQVVHKIFDQLKIPSYCKTSGATGLHIYVPLGAKYTFEQAKQFTEIIVNLAHKQLPNTTSLERKPIKRQKRVYLDYLQNRKGQTLAAAYSVRPKPGATVSTPLEWKEVKKGLSPKDFTIKNIFKRLEKKGDLWKPVLGKGIDLKKVLKSL